MEKKEKVIIIVCIAVTIAAGILHYTEFDPVVAFIVTAAALALLAMIVGIRKRFRSTLISRELF